MRKMIGVCMMLFSFSAFSADFSGPCGRMEMFLALGNAAGICNSEFAKRGKSALTTTKACLFTEKYNQQAGLLSIAVMAQTTPNLYIQCTHKYLKEFDVAEKNIVVWMQNTNNKSFGM